MEKLNEDCIGEFVKKEWMSSGEGEDWERCLDGVGDIVKNRGKKFKEQKMMHEGKQMWYKQAPSVRAEYWKVVY